MFVNVSRRFVLFAAFSSLGLFIATNLHTFLTFLRKAFLFTKDKLSLIVDGQVEFPATSPADQGIDSAQLDTLKTALAQKKTKAFVVVRNNQLVYEWYSPDHGVNQKHYTASAAKSVVGSLALAVALNDGLLSLDEPASTYIPQWAEDPQKSQITIEQLARHASGLENAEEDGKYGPRLAGWKGRYWRNKADRWRISIDEVPVIFPPGTAYAYSNSGMSALSYILAKVFSSSTLSNTYQALRQRIMQPLGIPDYAWSISYEEAYDADGIDLFYVEGGGEYTARALAYVGQLMLDKGNRHGKEILSAHLVEQIVSYTTLPPLDKISENPAPGLCWHTNVNGIFPSLPSDAFLAAGAEHQILCIVPSLNLVVVRMGNALGKSTWYQEFWQELDTVLFQPLIAAINPRTI